MQAYWCHQRIWNKGKGEYRTVSSRLCSIAMRCHAERRNGREQQTHKITNLSQMGRVVGL